MDTILYFLVLLMLICTNLIIKQHQNIYKKYKFIVYGVIVFLICVMSAYLYINNNKNQIKIIKISF